jgi:hypothetical protein
MMTLTKDELAECLHLTPRTVAYMVERGLLVPVGGTGSGKGGYQFSLVQAVALAYALVHGESGEDSFDDAYAALAAHTEAELVRACEEGRTFLALVPNGQWAWSRLIVPPPGCPPAVNLRDCMSRVLFNLEEIRGRVAKLKKSAAKAAGKRTN